MTNLKYLFICFVIITLQGCDQAKELVGIVMKSDEQRLAEKGCWDMAAYYEALRTRNFRGFANGPPPETTDLGNSHYLIKVSYKKITLDDMGQKSGNVFMYGYTTCEVINNKVTAIKLSSDGFN
jgi:hypothetical protein